MPTPEPQPQPQPQPQPAPKVEYVGLSQEMIAKLSITGPADPALPYWKIKRIEIQPETDNQSAWVIAPEGHYPKLFWGDGEAVMPWKGPDPYSPPGAKDGAYSQAMFHSWGNYGVVMEANSEVVSGIGLYGPNLEYTYTAHRPVLVYYQLVQPAAQEPEPEPSPPQPAPEIPYTLERRLAQAPYGFEDLRAEIRKFSDVKALDATARRNAQGNPLFHLIEFIVVHHSGYDKPHTPMSTARQAVAEGEPTIEYHFCIQEGKLFWTAPLVWVTNQTYQFNSRSIGVCVLGNYENKDPDPRDLETLRFFIAAFEEFMGQGWGKSRPVGLVPHRYVVKNATTCPGRIWPAVLGGLRPKLEVPK